MEAIHKDDWCGRRAGRNVPDDVSAWSYTHLNLGYSSPPSNVAVDNVVQKIVQLGFVDGTGSKYNGHYEWSRVGGRGGGFTRCSS